MLEALVGALGGFGLAVVIFVFTRQVQVDAQVARLQRQMDALLKHFGIDLTAQAVQEAQALMRAGKKIEAIKVYREYTGAGLAAAKEAVEKLL